nr:thioredoxin family protein [Allomuricauda sp.]
MKHLMLTGLVLLTAFSQAQSINNEIELENGKKFLLGKIDQDGLQQEPYANWYNNGYNNYVVDQTLINLFKSKLKDYHVKLFLGTWCGDSKREVPRFLKILKAAQFPMDQIDIVALDRRSGKVKTSPTGEERGLHIIRVPTMLFYKNGREVNRIVESPIETLEEDMAQILNGNLYTPNYATLSGSK